MTYRCRPLQIEEPLEGPECQPSPQRSSRESSRLERTGGGFACGISSFLFFEDPRLFYLFFNYFAFSISATTVNRLLHDSNRYQNASAEHSAQ